MGKNVMIPLSLLNQIINLLEHWDISDYGYPLRDEYGSVLWALNIKKQKLELRDAYAKIIFANHPNEQHEARMSYLQQKRRLYNSEDITF